MSNLGTIRTGFMPVPCLPTRFEILGGKAITFRLGMVTGSVVLVDAGAATLTLDDLLRDLVWCYSVAAGTMVIGSAYGRHVYVVDLGRLHLTSSLVIERMAEEYWNRLALLPLPNGSHVLVFSDVAMHLLTWTGQVVFRKDILPYTHFVALDNDAVTVRDADGELKSFPFFG